MEAIFIELPAFERYRAEYLSDDAYREFQNLLLASPTAGEVIKDSGGLRKIRFVDERRGKGKRGGIRVIYYWWKTESEFYLFTLYDKDQASDLTKVQRQTLRYALERIKGE